MTSLSTAGAEITLSAPITLRIKADWGQANLTRIAGWLNQEIGDRLFLSLSTVKTRLYQGLSVLRRELNKSAGPVV